MSVSWYFPIFGSTEHPPTALGVVALLLLISYLMKKKMELSWVSVRSAGQKAAWRTRRFPADESWHEFPSFCSSLNWIELAPFLISLHKASSSVRRDHRPLPQILPFSKDTDDTNNRRSEKGSRRSQHHGSEKGESENLGYRGTARFHRQYIFLWRINKGETSITLLSAEIRLFFFF